MNSPKTWLIALLTLTTLGGLVVAWRQQGEIAALRAAAMPRDERADFQKRVWELEKANRDFKQQLTTGREASTEGPATAPGMRAGRGQPTPAQRRDPAQQVGAMRDLMAKPEVQALVTLQQRGAIEARYAALFRALNLPPDQIARLTSLLTERTTSLIDIANVARDQGVDPRANAAAFQQLVAKEQDAINQMIKGVIGEAGFTQLSNYEQTLPQRGTVNELQQRLSYTGAPLSAGQAEQLVQILATNSSPRQGMGDAAAMAAQLLAAIPDGNALRVINAQGPGTAPLTPAAVTQAQSVLSPPQASVLQQMLLQQQAQQQLRQLVAETMNPNPPVAPKGDGKK